MEKDDEKQDVSEVMDMLNESIKKYFASPKREESILFDLENLQTVIQKKEK